MRRSVTEGSPYKPSFPLNGPSAILSSGLRARHNWFCARPRTAQPHRSTGQATWMSTIDYHRSARGRLALTAPRLRRLV